MHIFEQLDDEALVNAGEDDIQQWTALLVEDESLKPATVRGMLNGVRRVQSRRQRRRKESVAESAVMALNGFEVSLQEWLGNWRVIQQRRSVVATERLDPTVGPILLALQAEPGSVATVAAATDMTVLVTRRRLERYALDGRVEVTATDRDGCDVYGLTRTGEAQADRHRVFGCGRDVTENTPTSNTPTS